MKTKVVFRADGSSQIGLGHVIRSLALAEMLKYDFECVFAIQEPSQPLLSQIEAVCAKSITLPACHGDNEQLINELDDYITGNEIVVLDGYKFTTNYQQHIKDKGCQLVCIDDIHAYHFVADIVINHGLLGDSYYSCEPYTKVLLGPKYCLLRAPFLHSMPQKRLAVDNSIFLCFGGADKLNLTSAYLNRLISHEAVTTVHVVVGSAFEHLDILKSIKSPDERCQIHIHENLSADELAEVIKCCKVAIVPGSTISLECASLGIDIMCGYYVNNQLDIIAMLSETGMAVSIGDLTKNDSILLSTVLHDLLAENKYPSLQLKQKQFFDGRSKERLVTNFKSLIKVPS